MSRHAANALAALIAAQGAGLAAPLDGGFAESDAEASGQKPFSLPSVVVEDNKTPEVSSPKFTQPVVDTPQTIVVIPPEVYKSQGAVTLSDVLRNTPGITFFAGEGGSANRTGGDSFYLRGFDTSNSIFIDGVRDEGAVVHDVFNIEQVEVFKGPAPDNGRGGTAGYVNLESKMPELAPLQDILYSHGFGAQGSISSDRITLDSNDPLPLRGAAFRLNLMNQDGGVAGREFVENNRWGVARSLAFGLGSPTRVLLSYQHQYEHNLPDYGVPSTVIDGYAPPAPGGGSYFSPGVNLSNYYGFVDFDYEHVTNDAATARIEHDFASGFKLTNQTRYDQTDRRVEATSPSASVTVAPKGEVALSQGIYDTKNEILANQTAFTAAVDTGPLAHALSSGLELSREAAYNPTWAVVPLGVANPNYLTSIYAPENFPQELVNYDPHPTGTKTEARIDDAALYAFDTVKFLKNWEVNGGVRVEHYDIDELSLTTASPAVAASAARPATATQPATAAVAAAAAVPASAVDLGADRTVASWKSGLVYKPAPDGSLYASWSTSQRPPGASSATNTLSTTTTSADDPLLAPEKAINYEAGVKWTFFHDKLLADVALFRSVNTNVPAADPVSGVVDQTSDQTVEGVELGVSGRITEKWSVFGGYAQMEPKVSNEISTNAQGLTLPLLPKASGSLWTTYDLPHGVSIGAGVQYMGRTERLQATQAPTSTTFANGVPSYFVEGAMLSYAFDRHLTLRLNANNLFNRDYVASLNNNGYRLNLGTPRSILATAELRF